VTAQQQTPDSPGWYRQTGPVLCFHVLGTPAPQGAIRHLGAGRPAIHQNAKTLKPWRAQIQDAAEQAIAEQVPWNYVFPVAGPVGLYVCFTMPKPKSAPKRRTTWPTTRPDLSHLLRAAEDALVAAGAFKDDSQIVTTQTDKAYPGEHIQALHIPGALIRVYTIADPPQ
jgi:Holliday junction resolvase RusA-like endonuclease